MVSELILYGKHSFHYAQKLQTYESFSQVKKSSAWVSWVTALKRISSLTCIEFPKGCTWVTRLKRFSFSTHNSTCGPPSSIGGVVLALTATCAPGRCGYRKCRSARAIYDLAASARA